MARPTDKTSDSDFPSSLPEQQALVQSVRRELIKSQLVVLELNDRILQKETEKADAVAILGQAELVLEEKINHIMELDRVLNARIQELESAATAATSVRDELEKRLGTTKAEAEAVIANITERLDHANREIGQTHEMAGKIAAEHDTEKQTNRELRTELKQLARELKTANKRTAAATAEAETMRRSWVWKLSAPFRALFGPKP